MKSLAMYGADLQESPPPAKGSTPPRAPAFIVTIYGDVVEPRGGTLWMGTLIACCAEHGISESLVRTAVSRLVGAGRLEGVRLGRKSYYRLSAAARDEFRDAARLLFDPPPTPEGWVIALAADGHSTLPFPWTALSPAAALAPERADLPKMGGAVLAARMVTGDEDMAALATRLWPLADVALAYRCFVERYAPLANGLAAATSDDGTALALRLRLVHDYRSAALADPRLPRPAWPADWPAEEARGLFVRLYLALSATADRHVAACFADQDRLLKEETEATRQRLERLEREAAMG